MICIQNVSRDVPDSRPHAYEVRINNGPIIARFEHIRGHGLAACLLAASRAVDKAYDDSLREFMQHHYIPADSPDSD